MDLSANLVSRFLVTTLVLAPLALSALDTVEGATVTATPAWHDVGMGREGEATLLFFFLLFLTHDIGSM